jgi:hypothetical protein
MKNTTHFLLSYDLGESHCRRITGGGGANKTTAKNHGFQLILLFIASILHFFHSFTTVLSAHF